MKPVLTAIQNHATNPRIRAGAEHNPCRMVCVEPGRYQVIVSNVGTVYDGNDEQAARAAYAEYKADSQQVIGRAAGEDVTLMYKGEPAEEFIGLLSQADEASASSDAAQGAEPHDPKTCPGCRLRRALVGLMLLSAMRGE